MYSPLRVTSYPQLSSQLEVLNDSSGLLPESFQAMVNYETTCKEVEVVGLCGMTRSYQSPVTHTVSLIVSNIVGKSLLKYMSRMCGYHDNMSRTGKFDIKIGDSVLIGCVIRSVSKELYVTHVEVLVRHVICEKEIEDKDRIMKNSNIKSLKFNLSEGIYPVSPSVKVTVTQNRVKVLSAGNGTTVLTHKEFKKDMKNRLVGKKVRDLSATSCDFIQCQLIKSITFTNDASLDDAFGK